MRALRRALWNARLARTGPVLPHLRDLRRWAELDDEGVRELQDRRLADLLRAVASDGPSGVPWYRSRLRDHGVVGDGDWVDLSRFPELPPLDKADIRAAGDALRAEGADPSRLYANTSGGSTGEPLRFWQDADKHAWSQALKILFDEWAGCRTGDPIARLWGAGRDIRADVRGRVRAWLRNELVLDAWRMDDAVMRSHLAELERHRPVLILAYANAIFELARFAEREGIRPWSPRVVMTSAATLHPEMRATIERVFGTTVVDRYGSREVGDIACERPGEEGLVVSAGTHRVEILAPDGRPARPGEVGEIAVTALTNRAMPLLRYRIGDAAALMGRDVPSPVRWPRLEALAGRVTDIFYAPDGTRIYGGFFTRHFYHRPWLERFQVVQPRHDRIVVRLVTMGGASPPEADRAEFRASVADAMGPEVRVEFEVVDDIPPTPSGKVRYTISEVGPPERPTARSR